MITFLLPTATAVRGTIVMVAMMLNAPTVAGAELNVLMSGGFGGAYEKLLAEFKTLEVPRTVCQVKLASI